MRSKTFVMILVIALVLVAGGVFYAVNSGMFRSVDPGSGAQPTPTSPSVNTQQVEQTPALAQCIERANKSDANQTVIEQSIQNCHDQYGY